MNVPTPNFLSVSHVRGSVVMMSYIGKLRGCDLNQHLE